MHACMYTHMYVLKKSIYYIDDHLATVNNKSLAWLKFGELGELAYFAKLFSSKLNLPDILDKFAKLNATKFIAMQFCQTLAMPNFRRLQYSTMLAAL